MSCPGGGGGGPSSIASASILVDITPESPFAMPMNSGGTPIDGGGGGGPKRIDA
jgi:hypothetical protein